MTQGAHRLLPATTLASASETLQSAGRERTLIAKRAPVLHSKCKNQWLLESHLEMTDRSVGRRQVARRPILALTSEWSPIAGKLDTVYAATTHHMMCYLPAMEQRLQHIREQQDNDDVLKQVKQYCLNAGLESTLLTIYRLRT